MTQESWLDKAIREATERGEFDDLPGTGRPIPGLDATYDPGWWAKGFVSRERARDAGIELMAHVAAHLPGLLARGELEDVVAQVAVWNAEITALNEKLPAPDRLVPLDAGEIERRWHQIRRRSG